VAEGQGTVARNPGAVDPGAVVPRANDPDVVRAEHADESRCVLRAAAWSTVADAFDSPLESSLPVPVFAGETAR